MLDAREVLANFDEVEARLRRRDPSIDLGPIKALAERRRQLSHQAQELRTQQKSANERMRALAK